MPDDEALPDDARLARIGVQLHALGEEPLPEDVAARLAARLERELGPARGRPTASRRRWLPYAGLAVPGLAAVIAAVVIVGGRGTTSPGTPAAQVAAGKATSAPKAGGAQRSSTPLQQFGVTATARTPEQAAAVAAFRAQRAVAGAVEVFAQRCLLRGTEPCPLIRPPTVP